MNVLQLRLTSPGRSLRPLVHFVPFWNASTAAGLIDVYDVVSELRQLDQQDPSYVQRIIHEAQTFAMKCVSGVGAVRELARGYKGPAVRCRVSFLPYAYGAQIAGMQLLSIILSYTLSLPRSLI